MRIHGSTCYDVAAIICQDYKSSLLAIPGMQSVSHNYKDILQRLSYFVFMSPGGSLPLWKSVLRGSEGLN